MSAREVEPNFRDVGECGCGCGEFGSLKPPSRDGTRCVSRKCKCVRCRNRNNRKRGQSKQREAAKALGITGYVGNEETWADNMFRNEVKSDLLSAKVVGNAWTRIVAQIDAARPTYGDNNRPPRVVVMPPGWGKRGIVMVDTDAWRTLIAPALAEFYGSAS